MANVTHSEIVGRLAKKCDLSETEIRGLLDTMADQIAIGAAADGLIFRGFGRFRSSLVEKEVFNPRSNQPVGTRSYVNMIFKPLGDGVQVHE